MNNPPPAMMTAYAWAVATCNAPNIGYSQAHRNEETVDGITYYDCSSFIWYALLYGGFDVVGQYGSWPFTTYTMPSVLPRLGFTLLDPYNVEWQDGDILVFPGDISQGTGHTEMSYNGKYLMGAHNSHLPLADQVSISTYQSSAGNPYTQLYRFDGTPPGPMGSKVPIWLLKKAMSDFDNPYVWRL